MTRASTQPKAPSIVADFAVTAGRDLVGRILELSDGSHQAINADGELLGTFRSRVEASKAIAGASA